MATEKRLIKADEFHNALENIRQDYLEENTMSSVFAEEVIKMVQDILAQVPTVDAVEVVRCKDCQSHEPCMVRDRVWCKTMGRYMRVDGFCSEGKR